MAPTSDTKGIKIVPTFCRSCWSIYCIFTIQQKKIYQDLVCNLLLLYDLYSKYQVMEDYGSDAFVKSFIRFSCEVEYPQKLPPDAGSQLVKGCEAMNISFKDIKNKLYEDHNVEFKTCSVGGHIMHGRVERRIRQVKESMRHDGRICSTSLIRRKKS